MGVVVIATPVRTHNCGLIWIRNASNIGWDVVRFLWEVPSLFVWRHWASNPSGGGLARMGPDRYLPQSPPHHLQQLSELLHLLHQVQTEKTQQPVLDKRRSGDSYHNTRLSRSVWTNILRKNFSMCPDGRHFSNYNVTFCLCSLLVFDWRIGRSNFSI